MQAGDAALSRQHSAGVVPGDEEEGGFGEDEPMVTDEREGAPTGPTGPSAERVTATYRVGSLPGCGANVNFMNKGWFFPWIPDACANEFR